MTLRVVELFSGIGAQAQALENLGHLGLDFTSTVCEIDGKAHRSYCAIHGDTPNLGDITKVEHLPECDLLTYSYPCQDLSVAGCRRGMKQGSGTRSSLLWEVGRLLSDAKERERRPKVLLMENVDAILNKKNIGQFNLWIKTLSDMGYTSSWKILNASDFDIPQNRKRCFMVSCLDGKCFRFPEGRPKTRHLKDLLEPKVDEKYYLSPERIANLVAHKERHQALGHGFGFSVTNTSGNAKCVKSRYREEEDTLIQEVGAIQGDRIRRLTPRECWRLMGFPDSAYEAARDVPTSKTQLYKQAGNSIVVPCLEAIFKAIYIDNSWHMRPSLEWKQEAEP